AALRAEWSAHRGRILLASTMNLSGYLLVLFAYRVAPTAYVVAAREVAIPIAAVAGMTLLGEPRTPTRVASPEPPPGLPAPSSSRPASRASPSAADHLSRAISFQSA
nr:hypothetical protein [Myxococcota bacterium]